jgi:hypothetical protein
MFPPPIVAAGFRRERDLAPRGAPDLGVPRRRATGRPSTIPLRDDESRISRRRTDGPPRIGRSAARRPGCPPLPLRSTRSIRPPTAESDSTAASSEARRCLERPATDRRRRRSDRPPSPPTSQTRMRAARGGGSRLLNPLRGSRVVRSIRDGGIVERRAGVHRRRLEIDCTGIRPRPPMRGGGVGGGSARKAPTSEENEGNRRWCP